MKKMKTCLILAGFAVIFCNGCLTMKKEVKEPTIEKKTAQKQNTEVVAEDIEVIEQQDTSGRVSAAKEAAAKIIADARKRAKDLTRDSENIYAVKKQEAEANAEKIIADAKKHAEKEKKAILEAAKKENKENARKQAQSLGKKAKADAATIKEQAKAEVDRTLKAKKAETEKIANKIVYNAKKSAVDITKASYKHMLKARKDGDSLLAKANNYAKAKKKEADAYLNKKMAEADKAVTNFTQKMEKEIKGSGVPKSENEIKAQRMVDVILKAIPKNDYNTFSKDFTVDLKKRFTKDKFLKTNKTLESKLGDITKMTYLGFIRKGPLHVYMWKANFAKASKDNDMIVRLTLGELDKKLQVFAFDIAIL